jgi:hypothetical protein
MTADYRAGLARAIALLEKQLAAYRRCSAAVMKQASIAVECSLDTLRAELAACGEPEP